MKFSLFSKLLFVFLCLWTFVNPKNARADLGDAALTVGIFTGVGAVLGASTLPFYEDPGSNTKNIFYGAAIGAVTGVILASFSAMQEEKQDAVSFNPKDLTNMAQSSAIQEHPHSVLENSSGAIWSQLVAFKF